MERVACILLALASVQAVPTKKQAATESTDASPKSHRAVSDYGGSLVDMDLSPSTAQASTSEEANRIWQQLSVLDSRFAEVVNDYMGVTKRSRTLMRKEETIGGDSEVNGTADVRKAVKGHAASLDVEVLTDKHGVLKNNKVDYGFFIHAFFEAAAVVNQVKSIRKYYPEAPIYIVSDGGANFSGICKEFGNCKSAWRAPAHDCWNPKPFLERFYEAATWLETRKAEWTIFLEPDVTLNRRAIFPVKADAGGLRDMWNAPLPLSLREHMTMLGRNFSGNQNFSLKWDRFGFCGGSIVRTKAAKISFKPDYMDWPLLEKVSGGANQMLFSSDVAMLVALGSHGFNYYPWEDLSEGHDEFQPKHETAFVHHSKNEKGGKPFYGKPLNKEDEHLVSPPPQGSRLLKIGECQKCVWVNEDDCWANTNTKSQVIQCPTDQESFRKQAWPYEKPNPGLFHPTTGQLI